MAAFSKLQQSLLSSFVFLKTIPRSVKFASSVSTGLLLYAIVRYLHQQRQQAKYLISLVICCYKTQKGRGLSHTHYYITHVELPPSR